MRGLPLLLSLGLALPAAADRLITVPTATKLSEGTVRGEVLATPSRDFTRAWLEAGVGQVFEVGIQMESLDSSRIRTGLDLAYNYIVPITDISPGLAAGVLDANNQTEAGRALYFAVTYRFGNYGLLNQDTPTELTFGLWTRKSGAAFVALSLPFTNEVRLIAEHDSLRPTAGLELRPGPNAAFRVLFRRDEVIVGLRASLRF